MNTIPEIALKILSPTRIVPMCPIHPIDSKKIRLDLQEDWIISGGRGPAVKYIPGTELQLVHIHQNITAGTDTQTTYQCAEYITDWVAQDLWEVYEIYVKSKKGYRILEGPEGTKNKYLIESTDTKNRWYPEGTGKFSHYGLTVTEWEARLYALDLIAKRKSDLETIAYFHRKRLSDLDPERKQATGTYY